MNNKGFTLIELLAVIAILALLALLSTTAVTKLVKDAKIDLNDVQIASIKASAEAWGAENLDKLPENGECGYILLSDIKDSGLLDDNVKDLKTNKKIDDDLKIKIIGKTNTNAKLIYTYEVNPSNAGGCVYIGNTLPGLYDEKGIMLASWDELVNEYGLDVEKDYTSETYKESGSAYYVLNNNEELSSGTKMIISKEITQIGAYSFYTSNLTDIIILEGVTSIGRTAFASEALISITLPLSLTNLSNNAFFGCSNLKEIIIPEGVTSIGVQTFAGCSSLTNVTLPSSLTSIGQYAFISCSNLKEIIIPEGVTSIESLTFMGCSSLKTIYYSGTATGAPWGANNATVIK